MDVDRKALYEWRYINNGTTKHALRHTDDQEALCGKLYGYGRVFRWRGTGSRGEQEHLATLDECPGCTEYIAKTESVVPLPEGITQEDITDEDITPEFAAAVEKFMDDNDEAFRRLAAAGPDPHTATGRHYDDPAPVWPGLRYDEAWLNNWKWHDITGQ